ncbi:MAG: hypothetical protein PHO63_05295 [Bacilli bacterium]|nr:hypothetical protein [Bacilli bacterium]MDD4808507.1 hypothetical protein [Bacilli bacterium]
MRTFKIINTLILIIMVVINIFGVGNNVIDGKFTELLDNGILFLLLLIPFLTKKILKINLNELFKFLYYIFVIILVLFGDMINLIKYTLWFDKITHLYFGFLMSLVAILFIKYNNKNLKERIFFNILFISGFTLLVSNGWEFIEYALDKILHTNHQRWIQTCVDDTMVDLLVTFLGSIIIIISYFIEVKKNKFGIVFHSIRDNNNTHSNKEQSL